MTYGDSDRLLIFEVYIVYSMGTLLVLQF